MTTAGPIRRFKLRIAFDGTAYHGWHAGRSGRGVADQLHQALVKLFAAAPEIVGSSRTDSGVHALGMVAHFDLPEDQLRMPARQLVPALNALLPDDIRVLSAVRTCGSFHARFGATSKQYRYQVWNGPVMNPLLLHRAWHVPQALDISAMRAASAALTGRHDFRAFTSKRDGVLTDPLRTLRRCQVRKSGPLVTFILEGDGFLYKMCRGIVGTLVRTGRGAMTPEEVTRLLAGAERRSAGVNAPAHGLVLWKVSYSPRQSLG
jgi:tRNA pseudouridine38-40 synthase